MELARPQIPEKPQVAAKPRLRTAPPRPPKPFTSASLSTLSPDDQGRSHSKEPHIFQNGAQSNSSTSASKPNFTNADRATSVNTLSTSFQSVSPTSLEQSSSPSSPHSVEGKKYLSPSSTLSLPASFRNSCVRKDDEQPPLTLTTLTPYSRSSAVSSSLLLQRSPIRHVSPPKRAPPPTSPKPTHHVTDSLSKFATPPGIVHITREPKDVKEGRPDVSNVQPSHAKSEKQSLAEVETTHLKTHTDFKPGMSDAPVRKQFVTPPQRPTSPPSRSVSVPKRPSYPPSKSLSPAATAKLLERSSALPSGKDITTTADTKSSSEKKPVVPPPLPKTPPRGGVPRRPRRSSFKSTSSSETAVTLEEGQQLLETTTLVDNKAGNITHLEKLPLQHNQNMATELLNNLSNAHVNSTDAIQHNSEGKLEIVKNNEPDSHVNVSKTKTPPKPRPRTRSGLVPLVDSENFSQMSTSIESNENNINQNSITGSAKTDTSIENETDLQNSDIHQENLGGHIDSGVEECKHESEKDVSQNSDLSDVRTHPSVLNTEETNAISENVPDPEQSDTNIGQTSHNTEETSAISMHLPSPKHKAVNISLAMQSTEETSQILSNPVSPEVNSSKPLEKRNAILIRPPSSESHSHLNSDEIVSSNEATKDASFTDESISFFHEEPESTCGMLKEIEELLKNKLGDIERNLGNESAITYNLNSQETEDTGHHLVDETEASCEDNVSNPTHASSPFTSPVRPPRPKRQASKHLGSQESLNASTDSTSTECLADPRLTKANGLSSGSGKKNIPLKPKRTSAPRVNRSHSDVTGMKSIIDSDSSTFETPQQPVQEEVKPFLPPRLESLRRSESSSTCLSSPPPLPPRNKPRSASLKEIEEAGSELPPLPSRRSLNELSSSSKIEPEVAENLDQSSSSENITLPGSQSEKETNVCFSTNTSSKITSPAKLRPTRKAPPPPQNLPRRSATFSSGDTKEPDTGQSELVDRMDTTQSSVSSTVTRSTSLLSKPPSHEVEYHEISDHVKMTGEVSSQENKDTQPSTLSSQPCRTDTDDSQASLVSDVPEERSVHLSEDSARYLVTESSSGIPESPKMDKPSSEAKNSSPKEHKRLEKLTKNALIKKVAQGFGLGKSFTTSKSPEITLVVEEPSKVPADDSGKEKVSTSSNVVVHSVTHNKDSDSGNSVAVQDAGDFVQKAATASETTCFSTSSIDRPLSEVSQQSTSSEQESSGLVFEAQNTEEIVSSGTDTEPEEDKEEIYAQRKAKKVFFIAKEIVSSESTFVDVLKLLNLDFRIHISKSTETLGHPVVPSESLNKILDFLPQLQNFNEDLLKDLSDRIENWETNPRLADIFVKKGPFLKLYSSYIRNFENATAVLEDTMKRNSVFAAALKEFEMSPRCAKLALKHYMLKPIQRIPQYKLLLQDYLKHLNEGSADYKDTVTALNIVSEVADHANDSMRHGDNVQKLLEIQRTLIGKFEVIQPGRILVKQGELLKLSRKEMQPRMFFLFNDVLLYTTPATAGYKINNVLPLTGMKINFPKLDDYKFEFNIISVQRSFTLSASSSEEKEQWVSAIQTAIEDNVKKHHTFQTVGQETQISIPDKDFVLGHKAPLWVPDARVTMCMLCLLEFTLIWRRHHCRACGRVVCFNCSKNKARLLYLKGEPARVCDICVKKLREDGQYQPSQGRRNRRTLSLSEEDSTTSVSEEAVVAVDEPDNGQEFGSEAVKHDSGLSLNYFMSKFQKVRMSGHDKRKPSNFRPSVLKEVHANDEGSDMSGYLRVYRSRKWKQLWFVVKGKVLYTYKASEDMAAIESMPLLGFEVTKMNTWFDGAEPDLLFELTHQNNQPLTTGKDGKRVSPSVVPGVEKNTQRLIFRTDSAASTTKWVTVLREASIT